MATLINMETEPSESMDTSDPSSGSSKPPPASSSAIKNDDHSEAQKQVSDLISAASSTKDNSSSDNSSLKKKKIGASASLKKSTGASSKTNNDIATGATSKKVLPAKKIAPNAPSVLVEPEDEDIEIVSEHLTKKTSDKLASVAAAVAKASQFVHPVPYRIPDDVDDDDNPIVRFTPKCHALIEYHYCFEEHYLSDGDSDDILNFSNDDALQRTSGNSGPTVCAEILAIIHRYYDYTQWVCKAHPVRFALRAILAYKQSSPHASIHDFCHVVFCLWVMRALLLEQTPENTELKNLIKKPDFPALQNGLPGFKINNELGGDLGKNLFLFDLNCLPNGFTLFITFDLLF